MQRSSSALIQELTAALINTYEVAQASQGSAARSWRRKRVERKAIARYCDALDAAVYHDPSWNKLARDVSARKPPTWDEPRELTKLVASALLQSHAEILRQIGYRFPPPPVVEDLLSQTRRSVLTKERRSRWGPESLDNVRFALAYFSNMLRVHLGNPDGMPSGALLGRIRHLGSASLLLLLLTQVEVETGEALEIRLRVTTKDLVTFTIIVPVDGPEVADVVSSLVNSQMSDLAAAVNLGWIGPSKDEASLSDWFRSAQARTTSGLGESEVDGSRPGRRFIEPADWSKGPRPPRRPAVDEDGPSTRPDDVVPGLEPDQVDDDVDDDHGLGR